MGIKYLHTMVRVKDLEKSKAFYELLGLVERRRIDNDKGRFSLVFMCPPDQADGTADVEQFPRSPSNGALTASTVQYRRAHMNDLHGEMLP